MTDTVFTKTNYVCSFDPNSLMFESLKLVSLGMCALMCNQNTKCFSFQHNKQNQQCKTSKWNIYDVQNCDNIDNIYEAVYLKELKYTLCPPGFDLSHGESCYFYSGRSRANYDDASEECKNLDGYLVSINTEKENEKLKEFLATQDDYKPDEYNGYWFGAKKVIGTGNPGTWKWEDGTNVVLDKWHPNEPEGRPGDICMVVLSKGDVLSQDYFWADLECEHRYPYVCEMKP